MNHALQGGMCACAEHFFCIHLQWLSSRPQGRELMFMAVTMNNKFYAADTTGAFAVILPGGNQ